MYYAQNRFYDAQTGVFLSQDPVKNGLNWYSYCGNNPTSYVDPLGLAEKKPDQMSSTDQYLESADLSVGRLQLSGCGYQGRKSRQSEDVLDYLQNTESGQKKAEEALFPLVLVPMLEKVEDVADVVKSGRNSIDTPINSGVSKPRDVATSNFIYEQMNPDGNVKSRAFYDEKWKSV